MTRKFTFACITFLISALFAAPLAAQSADPPDVHLLFEEKCMACHGHAGAFARENLKLEGGQILTAGGLPVDRFLISHRGGLALDAIELFVEMFRLQLESGGLYRKKCVFCHESRAYDFVRLNLFFRDGELVGRYSDRDVASFLTGHAQLDPSEAKKMTQVLVNLLRQMR